MPTSSRVMHNKLLILIIPYIISYLVSISLSMALRWTLEVHLSTDNIDEMILSFWGPFVISFVIFWFVLKKRMNIIKNEKLTPFPFIALISIMTLMPNFFAQDFISNASFNLININSVEQIQKHKNEKFFKIEKLSVKQGLSTFYNDYEVTGKYGQTLTMRVYVATPIISNSGKSVWHGVTYYKSINNNLEDEEKDEIFKKFYSDTIKEFRKYDFENVDYFKLLRKSYKTNGLISAINRPNSEVFIIEPVLGDFTKRLDVLHFNYIMWSLLIFMFMLPIIFILFEEVNQVELKNYLSSNTIDNELNKSITHITQGVGRNDLCPCGSGKKYKKCHLII